MKNNCIAGKTIAATTAMILLGATQAIAAGSYEIYTYGSGDFVAQVLRGVALVMSGGYIQTLIKVILLVGLLTALLNPITSWLSSGGARPGDGGTGGEGMIAILRQVLLAVIVMYVFIIPKTNVAIIDRYDPSQSQVVSDVPFMQGIIAHGASIIGDVIGREMEAAFTLPDALTFRNGGLGVGVKHINNIYNVLPPGPDMDTGAYSNLTLVSLSLREYYNSCVFPNFATLDGPNGPKTTALRDLMQSSDIFATLDKHKTLFGDTSKWIAAPTPTGEANCLAAPGIIKNVWNAGKTPWIQHIEKESKNGISAIVLQRYFPNGGDYFTMLQTIAAGNIMRSTLRGFEAKNTGHASQIAADQALSSTVGGWQTTAKMFEKLVTVMRNVFEGLIYGLSVFLPVAIAVAGLKPVGAYMKIVLWLQLWVPFYVLLNLFGDMELARSLSRLSMENDGSFPSLAEWKKVGEITQTSLAYLGSLSFTIPMFAWGLMQGGSYAMASAVRGMSGGGATAAAQSVGSQAGLDSLQYGNRRTNMYANANGTAFTSDFDAARTLGLTSGAASITGLGENASAHYNAVGARGAGMEAGLNSVLRSSDTFTMGQVSGTESLAGAHSSLNAGTSTGLGVYGNAAGAGFLQKTTAGNELVGLQDRGVDPAGASKAMGDKKAADAVAEMGITAQDRDTRAFVGTQKGVGDADAYMRTSKDYNKSVRDLAATMTDFDNMSKMERLEAFGVMGGSREGMRNLLGDTNRSITRATAGGAQVSEAYSRTGGKGYSNVNSGSNATHYAGSSTTVQGHNESYIGAGSGGTAVRAAWGAINALNAGNESGYRAESSNIASAIAGRGPNSMERLFGDSGNVEVLKATLTDAATRYGNATGQDTSYTSADASATGTIGVAGHGKDQAMGKILNLVTGMDVYGKIEGSTGIRTGSQGLTKVQTEDLTKAIHGRVDQVTADNVNYPTAQSKMDAIMGYAAETSQNLRDAGDQGNLKKAFYDSTPTALRR